MSKAPSILGAWRLLKADSALDFAPGVRMEFTQAGQLRYSFDVGSERQVVSLLYVVDGATLRTENPATGHEMVANFAWGAAETLVFDFAGARAYFVRELTRTPFP